MYKTVIGLEVHVHLATKTKCFCGCSTAFGQEPNSQTCPVCLGFPGSLPVLNEEALKLAIKTALAVNCQISKFIKFDRKNYFYPDLPKNFQISQYDFPIASGGYLSIHVDGSDKKIRITRAHLEEDAGKLIHQKNKSLVDFNRCGMPLLEIVSEPDINSSAEAYEYLVRLKSILEYLEVSDCNMEEGSLRCDANISLMPKEANKFGEKVELKNMNSFKGVKQALEHEIKRQTELLNKKKRVHPETRLWDEKKQVTVSMRSKEEAHDYRYFPEPDLMPFILDDKYIHDIQNTLPELPCVRRARFISEYKIPEYDASILTADKYLAQYFENCVKIYTKPKVVSNWIMGELLAAVNARNLMIRDLELSPESFVAIFKMIDRGTISGKIAKELLPQMLDTKAEADEIVRNKGLVQISDTSQVDKFIDQVIAENPKPVNDFYKGKLNALGFLVGQIMRKSQGRVNPKITNQLLREKLERGKNA